MVKKIIVMKKISDLEKASKSRSFTIAKDSLASTLKPKEFSLDEYYHPVQIRGKAVVFQQKPKAEDFDYSLLNKPQKESLFVVRADFKKREDIDRIKENEAVVGVFADPKVYPFPGPYCGEPAVGTWRIVGSKLGVRSLKNRNITGKGIRIAIVDTGIDGSIVPVDGGWAPSTIDYVPGSRGPDHGTMCAFDAKICAPDSKILDYALLQSEGATWSAFLSDSIAAFSDLIDQIERKPGPLVVSNSWGMFDRREDEPIGSPENYSANPDHPFNQIVGSLVAAGADVLFAAGNCGKNCPDSRCGRNDVGPGKSIHAANSHPDVITVAAITTSNSRLGYSSQGPGALYQRKPDIAGYSHFKGSGVYDADSGTSAACPVAAGVIGALRQKYSNSQVTPQRLKGIIQRASIDINGNGWDYDFGYGIINARRSLLELQ